MKLDTYILGNELKKLGFHFNSGVPCSFLSNLINYAINEETFIMAANEGDAVATCAGAHMAGKKSIVLMQNSGLTNALSPLTSLNYPFKIPVLAFVSLRGELGINDEPQHELMGSITEKMIDLIKIKWEYLSNNIYEVREQLKRANDAIENNESFMFIVKKNILDKVVLNSNNNNNIAIKKSVCLNTKNEIDIFTRCQVLETISKIKSNDTLLLATTGKTGRELYEIDDARNNFYMVGSMGTISSLGLGIALNSNKHVIAIDGDGAFLMRMGNLATNGFYCPPNLLHILIDNNAHDSTGGQRTVSGNVDFVSIASSSGYENVIQITSLSELEEEILAWKLNHKLTFMYVKVDLGTKPNLGRPKTKPFEVKKRLMEFLNE